MISHLPVWVEHLVVELLVIIIEPLKEAVVHNPKYLFSQITRKKDPFLHALANCTISKRGDLKVANKIGIYHFLHPAIIFVRFLIIPYLSFVNIGFFVVLVVMLFISLSFISLSFISILLVLTSSATVFVIIIGFLVVVLNVVVLMVVVSVIVILIVIVLIVIVVFGVLGLISSNSIRSLPSSRLTRRSSELDIADEGHAIVIIYSNWFVRIIRHIHYRIKDLVKHLTGNRRKRGLFADRSLTPARVTCQFPLAKSFADIVLAMLTAMVILFFRIRERVFTQVGEVVALGARRRCRDTHLGS